MRIAYIQLGLVVEHGGMEVVATATCTTNELNAGPVGTYQGYVQIFSKGVIYIYSHVNIRDQARDVSNLDL